MRKNEIKEIILNGGVSHLANVDLLSIIMNIEYEEKFHEINELLTYYDKLQKFRYLKIDEMTHIKGFTKQQACQLIAALELSKRVYKKEIDKRTSLFDSEDVYELIRDEMEYLEQESLVVVSLDIKGKVLKKETVYIGTTSSIPVSVKEVFKTPIKLSAYGFIIIHNHPTGDAKPSSADDKLTKKIVDASEILSIEMIDHIIVGKSEFYSYKNKKIFKI